MSFDYALEMISFCNELVGDFVKELNCDEIFILLMAAYLHDAGMGISKKDFDEFSEKIPGIAEYTKNHPDAEIDEVIREFHNELSGKYIEKYKNLFDFPSEKHLFSVIQVSRGHRRTNLYDKDEYPDLDRLFVKLGATLSECVKVVSDRTPFEIRQNKIETINI